MKKLGMIGCVTGILVLAFGLYVHFSVVPESEVAQAAAERMQSERHDLMDTGMAGSFDNALYMELMVKADMKVDYGIYLFVASWLPILLSVYPAIKKDKMGIIGLLLSVVAFFIGAAHGTHMFS